MSSSNEDQEMCLADGSSQAAEARALEEDGVLAAVQESAAGKTKPLEEAPKPAPLPDPGVVKRINPNLLYQPFWSLVEQLLRNCEARGVRYYVISGFRSFDEQGALYAQGRSKPGKIVTKAKAGMSAHQYGVAVDFCRDKDMAREGLQPDWNPKEYEILAEEAEKLGLEPGLRWKFVDAPHVQLPLGRRGIELKDLLGLYSRGGLKAVHHLLDKTRW